MTSLLQDAVRWMRRRPAMGVLAVSILTMGFAVALVGYSVSDVAWLHPFAYPQPEQVYAVTTQEPHTTTTTNLIDVEYVRAWRAAADVPALGAYQSFIGYAGIGDGSFPVRAVRLSSELLKVLAVEGTGHQAPSGDGLAILSEPWWTQVLRSDRTLLSASIRLNDGQFRIVGLAPQAFSLPGLSTRPAFYAIRSAAWPTDDMNAPARVRVLVRLPSPSARLALEKRLSAIAGALPGSSGTLVTVTPVRVLSEAIVPGQPIFLVAIASALLLALVNVGHLYYSVYTIQGSSFAIHIALGSSMRLVFLRVLAELLSLGLVAVMLGCLVAYAVLRLLSEDAVLILQLSRPPVISPTGVLLIVLIVVGSGCALSARVLVWLRKQGPNLLRAQRRTATTSLRLQRTLIGTQIFLSGSLVFAAFVSASVYLKVTHQDLGMHVDGILFSSVSVSRTDATTPEAASAMFSAILRDLRSAPGIRSAALADVVPFVAAPPRAIVSVEGGNGDTKSQQCAVLRVSQDYFDTLTIPVRGRVFTEPILGPATEAVVSEQAMRVLGLAENPIGRDIRVATIGQPIRIVGVAGDVRGSSADRPPEPTIYVTSNDSSYPRFMVSRGVLVAPSVGSARVSERQTVDGVLGRYQRGAVPMATRPLTERITGAYQIPRIYAEVAGGVGVIALTLGALGTYMMVAFVSAARQREIAIRVVCGATSRHVVRLHMAIVGAPMLAGVVGAGMAVQTIGRPVFSAIYGRLAQGMMLPGVLGLLMLTAIAVVVTGLVGLQHGPATRHDRNLMNFLTSD